MVRRKLERTVRFWKGTSNVFMIKYSQIALKQSLIQSNDSVILSLFVLILKSEVATVMTSMNRMK